MMRRQYIGAAVAAAAVSLVSVVSSGAQRLSARDQRVEGQALEALVNAVAAGQPPGGDAWLRWDGHFLRAADGKTYVPFTLTIDEAPDAFESITMYVRVVRRGEQSQARSAIEGALNTRTGELPVSVPERQFARGAPTAGEASARLSSLQSELSRTTFPFAGLYAAQPKRVAPPVPPSVRRALVVPPGEYDLYVAVRERPKAGGSSPKWAVITRPLTVPDFSRDELLTSSVILAERIDALGARLSEAQQAERPYALGGAEIVPKPDTVYRRDEALTLVFFLYNVATGADGSPDVTVRYQFSDAATPWKMFAETAPQRFAAGHEIPIFDARAGRQLVVTQAVPLGKFAPGDYELQMLVSDNFSGRSTRERVTFRVSGEAR